MTTRLTEADISEILVQFYDRVKADDSLGPVFAVVEDWDEHLLRLSEFWSSIMLTTGRYKGDPLSMHLVHAEKFQPFMFNRWLEIWRQTTDEIVAPEVAREMQARAKRIASRFSIMICGEDVPATITEQTLGQPMPYRTSSLFDEETLPRALLEDHALKPGTWGIIRVEAGNVLYREIGKTEPHILEPGRPGFVSPQVTHSLKLVGPVILRVEFYDRRPLEFINIDQERN